MLGIMLARPAESEPHRLETCTTLDGVPFHQVTRDSRLWRRLRPSELDAGARGGGRISMMNNRLGLVHAWHVVPLRKELETEDALALPDVERGKLMHLVLPLPSKVAIITAVDLCRFLYVWPNILWPFLLGGEHERLRSPPLPRGWGLRHGATRAKA